MQDRKRLPERLLHRRSSPERRRSCSSHISNNRHRRRGASQRHKIGNSLGSSTPRTEFSALGHFSPAVDAVLCAGRSGGSVATAGHKRRHHTLPHSTPPPAPPTHPPLP